MPPESFLDRLANPGHTQLGPVFFLGVSNTVLPQRLNRAEERTSETWKRPNNRVSRAAEEGAFAYYTATRD